VGAARRQLTRPSPFVILALALLAPASLSAEVRFAVSGQIRTAAPALELDLRLRNSGDSKARALAILGELAGQHDVAELAALSAGESSVLTLRFPARLPRPGRYALALRIEYRPDQPADAPLRHAPGFLLVDLGGAAQPALAIRVEPPTLDVAATALIVVESADGAAHRAGVRVLLPSGINVREAPAEVDVPAAGRVSVPVRLIRGDAARGSRQQMLVVAGPVDGSLERTSVAQAEIQIAPDPAWLPRLRPGLVALGALLLLAATALEWRVRRSTRR